MLSVGYGRQSKETRETKQPKSILRIHGERSSKSLQLAKQGQSHSALTILEHLIKFLEKLHSLHVSDSTLPFPSGTKNRSDVGGACSMWVTCITSKKSQWIYQILIKESPQGKSPASRWTQKVMRPTRSTSFESFSVLKICSKVKTHRAGKSTWCKLIKPVRLGTVFRSRFKTGFKQPFHLSKHWRRQAKHKVKQWILFGLSKL